MRENWSRRKLLKTAAVASGASILKPWKAEAAEKSIDSIVATIESLENGLPTLHGVPRNPRRTGYKYHPVLIQRYARSLQLPDDTPLSASLEHLRKALLKRIEIYPVKFEEEARLRQQCAIGIKEMEEKQHLAEIGAVVYISKDRTFQRLYLTKKINQHEIAFLESLPISTSKAEPRIPRIEDVHHSTSNNISFTPLGMFKIPLDGVRPALLGEVTKVERPDITKYYFESINIDGTQVPFVRNLGKTEGGEIITVTGDTHLLYSREIAGRGIKIHDTTELETLGAPVSSGCIRTPAVRRLTMLTSTNKYPTFVYIYWEKTNNHPERDEGFGGMFGGERLKK